MDCSTPEFSIHHQLPKLAQTHFHWVGDAIQPIRIVSSVYLSLLIFLPAVLILACESTNLAFCMMYSAHKLNKQGDNIQPWCSPFLILHQYMNRKLPYTSWILKRERNQRSNYKKRAFLAIFLHLLHKYLQFVSLKNVQFRSCYLFEGLLIFAYKTFLN